MEQSCLLYVYMIKGQPIIIDVKFLHGQVYLYAFLLTWWVFNLIMNKSVDLLVLCYESVE